MRKYSSARLVLPGLQRPADYNPCRMPLQPGTRLGPYEIVEQIGAGGMGDVYRARDSRLERDVAIKVLPERVAGDPAALARFEREAKAVAALSHPNILAIHDYGSANGIVYSVTELLDGQTLRQRLQEGAFPWRKVVEIGAAIADGVAAAHSKGIIHRDLKPENIILTTDGRVKVLDFGVAQLITKENDEPIDHASTPTVPMGTYPGVVIGTAGYIPPEVLRGGTADERSDIFSIGCVLYEMLTGRRAFQRATMVDSLSAVLTEHPEIGTETVRTTPPDLARVIERCLEKKAGERFHSARDLAFALRAIGTSTSTQWTEPPRAASRPTAFIVALAVAAGTLIGLVIVKHPRQSVAVSAPSRARTIAVLPFVNATRDANAEYIADGMTETLINTLSQFPGLKVMSRTSVFHFKNEQPDPWKAARELGVSSVLVGRISGAGDKFAVSVELVNGTDRTTLWGARYTTEKSDLFSVQQSIASEISRSLRLTLTGREQQRIARRNASGPAAYDLYLRGRFQWNKRSAEGLYKAIEYFNQAIEADPRFALAYAGLADCYNLLDIWANLPTRETFPKAKAAARKALELDEELAEAHTSLAYAVQTYEWDAATAEREYRRALQLNPNYATAHQWYAEFLTSMGRFNEAETEAKQALALDPMSPIINAVAGWNFTMARRYDAAIEQNLRTSQLFPSFMAGHAYLGLAYLESGRATEAIPALERARRILDIPVIITWLIRAHLAAGHGDEARRLLSELQDRGRRNEYLPPYYMAAVFAHMNGNANIDRAFKLLDQAVEERTGALVWLKVDPAWDPIRDDPRFKQLAARAGLK